MQEKKIFIKNKYDNKLCGILNELSEDKCMTIICHARGSHKDSRATFNIATTLTENNINNFRFDFTSDGESEGNELDVNDIKLCEDLESVIDFFKKKDYKESSNFAAENPKAYHPLGFPLLLFIRRIQQSPPLGIPADLKLCPR